VKNKENIQYTDKTIGISGQESIDHSRRVFLKASLGACSYLLIGGSLYDLIHNGETNYDRAEKEVVQLFPRPDKKTITSAVEILTAPAAQSRDRKEISEAVRVIEKDLVFKEEVKRRFDNLFTRRRKVIDYSLSSLGIVVYIIAAKV
jgi:hypothetical protein